MRKDVKILIAFIAVVTVFTGASFAYYNYTRTGTRNAIFVGELYMYYNTNNTLSLSEAFPTSGPDLEKYVSFTISGKNTNVTDDIWYEVGLVHGDEVEGREIRLRDDLLRFTLTEQVGSGEEKVVLDSVSYDDLTDRKIWVKTIPRNTTSELEYNYKLYMWIDENVTVGNVDGVTYLMDDWNKVYASIRVKVTGDMGEKSLPLTVQTSDEYVESSKSYFRAKMSNDYVSTDEGKVLETPDVLKLEISNPENKLYFNYRDSKGNEDLTNRESLTLNYTYSKNETIDFQVFTISKNDANVSTDVHFKVTKNGEVVEEFTQKVNVMGNNYCLNNGFNKLYDCLLVSERLSNSVDSAKTQIASKGEADVNHTAPTYQYIEEQTETAKTNVYQGNASYPKWYFTDTYTFNDTTGTFTLKNNDSTPISTQYELNSAYIGKYTCGTTNTSYSGCSTIYKVTGVHTDTRYIDGDKITYKIFGSLDSQVGLYAAPDDQGTSYVFRGNVSNNNVLFGGYYWKVLRTNGDGSIRLIFNGAAANATGNDTAIANNANGYGTTYAFNPVHPGPTYVGYMYNENATSWESNATTDGNWTEETVYYWAAKTDFDELTDDYGTYWKLKSGASTIQKKLKEMTTDDFTNYGYTCKGTAATSTCRVLFHVHSRSGVTSSQSSYITMSPNTTDKSVVDTNNKESNAKKQLEKWYAEKLATKTNAGKSVTAYIVDNTFCNDRSILNPYTKGSYTLNNSYNSGYLLTNHTYYAARSRLVEASQGNKSATLLCANNNDKFSKTAAYGNAKLSYPVGLITADEFALAGGKFNEKNERFYLRTNGYYWTMSPSNFNSSYANAHEFNVYPSGMMLSINVTLSNGLRAVINLSSETLITQGDGTIDNPYELSI